jgi:hypothetical protein
MMRVMLHHVTAWRIIKLAEVRARGTASSWDFAYAEAGRDARLRLRSNARRVCQPASGTSTDPMAR